MDYHFSSHKMTLLLWFFMCNILLTAGAELRGPCVTGLVTDKQAWVDANGELTENVDTTYAVDLSTIPNPSLALYHRQAIEPATVRYLSMARCQLLRVPRVFDSAQDIYGRNLSQTLEYLTFFGNRFQDTSVSGKKYLELDAKDAGETTSGFATKFQIRATWSAGFRSVQFSRLRELDLRSCAISYLEPEVFENMPQLKALYLGENAINIITSQAFAGLTNLLHLDLSNNQATDENGNVTPVKFEHSNVFSPLENLRSLDFSYTTLNTQFNSAFHSFGKNLESLSLCHTGLYNLERHFFGNTSIQVLDLSGNFGILLNFALDGLEDTLRVLYANEIGLANFEVFENFSRLEVLVIASNEISKITRNQFESLRSLQVLNLNTNRLPTWFSSLFGALPLLRYLDLRFNMINIISRDMIKDIGNISYVGMSFNPVVCNCYGRDFFDIASRNEVLVTPTAIKPFDGGEGYPTYPYDYHLGFLHVNYIIEHRLEAPKGCIDTEECYSWDLPENATFLLFDYAEFAYSCLKVGNGVVKMPIHEVSNCNDKHLLKKNDDDLRGTRITLLVSLLIPGIVLPILALLYMFRRDLRYCYVTVRNSAMLSMVNKHKIASDDSSYNYDVFVSYCNEDRGWVLEKLLSHLETDCSVSLCLHERDFQVGLSILQNIVNCMDRSKAIMLVLSQQFLLSHWCQFELHLAQHRLLETRREDLILILLEDIPRRLRPNTLHYLMLTKTYIVWPKNKSEEHLFWKRLKKSVTTQKQKPDRVTLA